VERLLASFVVAVLTGLVCAPAAQAQTNDTGATIALAPDAGQETRTLDFGEERDEKSVTIRFLAPAPLPAAPEVDLTDAQTTTGLKLDGTVVARPATLTQGKRTVLVTVVVTPTSSADAGSYDSQMLLRGAGLTDARSALTIKLDPAPVSGAWWKAILLLLVGASLGVFARWVATEASALKGLQDRLGIIETTVAPHAPRLPVAFSTTLVKVRMQIDNEDTSGAATTLTDLEGKTQAAVAAANATARLHELLAAQQTSIASMPNLGPAAARLSQVVGRERLFADEFAADDYSSDAGGKRREDRIADVQRFNAFLPDYAIESNRSKLEDALDLFQQGKFGEAEQKWAAATDNEAPVGVAAAQPFPAVSPPARKRTVRNWVIRRSPEIWLAITALALVLLGLFTVYDPATTFRTEPFLDSVKLFAWGLGSALTGAGIADLASKLTAGKPAPP
jgi:hypothetical protein